ncbi:hypothetical protein EV196_102620 [Mariniflexile fucanivorans]|uniref:Uncharacterized protein n=1 Tax=Mariniflexile fucanivorans TaxID=264023 RepID=A0A4R1RP74_9FLAO|nr:hypothetical protein EV196_102620 [Mariniflexile fucanivorans]
MVFLFAMSNTLNLNALAKQKVRLSAISFAQKQKDAASILNTK